jgi:hypothetical protein
MQKSFRSFAEKMFLPVSFSFVLLLSGCGGTIGDKDTDEAKKYEVAMALDSGDYDKAIEMLEADCAGYDYEECKLNLGAAYLGKAGMDIISLGTKLTIIDGNNTTDVTETVLEQWKDTQTMTVLFDIILDDAVSRGAQVYKQLLPQGGDECNGNDYDSLTTNQKNACIAVNPILLQEILGDEDTKTDVAVDIETISQFKDVLGAVIPGITTTDIVSVLDNSEVGDSDDVNNNDDVDSMEATDCAVKVFNAEQGPFADDYNCIPTENTVSARYKGTVPFTHDVYSGVDIYEVDVNVSNQLGLGGDDSNFTRLVTLASGSTTTYTSVTTNGYCGLDGVTTCAAGSTNCYPCPVVKNGELQTLSGTVLNVLNNEDLLTSIAIMSDSDDDKTSDQKIQEFKDTICYSNYDNEGTVLSVTNVYQCDANGDITQNALLDYMARDE